MRCKKWLTYIVIQKEMTKFVTPYIWYSFQISQERNINIFNIQERKEINFENFSVNMNKTLKY